MDINVTCLCMLVVAVCLHRSSVSGGLCTYTKWFRKYTANCAGRKLEEIPSRLDRSIEVLMASENRIREISNTTLGSYTNLQMIYLRDNFLLDIEELAFSNLNDLEVLDVSKNALTRLPAALPLPLRTLYLHQNRWERLDLSAAFNLQHLSIAECKLTKVPRIGTLPNLEKLNLTFNPLTEVTPDDLAPFCRLKTLYLPPELYSHAGNEGRCRCYRLLTWTSHHNIAMPKFNCTPLAGPDEYGCDMNMTLAESAHAACLNAEPPSTLSRSLLLMALAAAVLLAALVLCCWWRKGRRKANSVQDHHRARPAEKSAKVNETLIT